MARKRKYPRNFAAIPFNAGVALGTLNQDTVEADSLTPTLGRNLFVTSVKALWAIRGLTATEGPIMVGVAHGDLTDTEILEQLQAEQSDPSDIIQAEKARRPVRKAGVFPGLSSNEALNDGKPIKVKCMFPIDDADNIKAWAMNLGSGQLTTGCVLQINGTVFGRWL